MKKSLLLVLFIIPEFLFSQYNINKKFGVEANIGILFPTQGEYLRENWNGKLSSSINFFKSTKFIDYKIGLDFDLLGLSEDRINILSPVFGIRKSIVFSDIIISPGIDIGYSFIRYTLGKGLDIVDPIEKKQKGFNTGISLDFKYMIKDNFFIGLGNKYTIIYEPFGADIPKPDNSNSIGLYKIYINIGVSI